jgi:uncharacterized cupin superfamily protein
MIKKTNVYTGKWREASHGEKFQREHMTLTDSKDSHGIGCGAFRVKPGKRAFPKHAHVANDEAIFVISGQGQLTLGDETTAVTAGDYIMLPRGEKNAHILVNDSDADIVYLCISTMLMPEIVHYPDSGKLGVLASKNFWQSEAGISGFYQPNPVGYWDGED